MLDELLQQGGRGGAYASRRRTSPDETVFRTGTLEPAWFTLTKNLLDPGVVFLTLIACVFTLRESLSVPYLALGVLSFIVSQQVISAPDPGNRDRHFMCQSLPRLLGEWGMVIAVLLFVGFALKVTEVFSRRLLMAWFAITPMALVVARAAVHTVLHRLAPTGQDARTHVIVGANEVGRELARRLRQSSWLGTFEGFFDDRNPARLPSVDRRHLLGTLRDVAEYARTHGINVIYIALPMSGSPRMLRLLNELRDTTASVYFVPDIFVFDLIQARFISVHGIPAVSIYETPFQGHSALLKRASDVLLAGAALAVLWPAMLLIAAAVKLTSAGPVLFKQRRYGLDGEEILVYKFRSMTVCEDGANVTQATRNDSRMTSIGKFLRRTSLDELPQLLNVLEGKMSLVGPRPHAVAHNEQYRKLINGYMLRHKIRPGITGWAQVNGLRGETETVDKMRRRIEYDLDYLRRWSVWLDVKIMFRTVFTLGKDPNAY